MNQNLKGQFLAAKIWQTLLIPRLSGLLLAVLLFGACAPKQTEQEASDSLLGKAEADIFNESGYPIVKEPITLKTIYAKQATHGDLDQMPTLVRLQEKSGIALDIEQIPGNAYNEKVNLMFASGELPDFIPSWGPSNLISYLDLLRPLAGYIDTYMPNLASFFAKRPDYRKMLKMPNGEIYQLPMVAENLQFETPYQMFINKKWLDALNLEVPQTTDEFYEALKAFKEQDPNGNGKNDEIPITYTGTGEFEFVGSFTFPFENGSYLKVDAADKVQFVPITEEEGFLDFVEWWQKLYQEGLVDPEVYTQDGAVYYAKGKTDPLGAFREWFDENVVGNEAVADYVMVNPLRGPDGKKQAMRARNIMSGRTFLLSAQNPYPASTMRLMDMGYEPDFAWQITYGPWDIVLERAADGKISALPPRDGLSEDEWRYANTPGYAWPYGLLSNEFENWLGPNNDQRKALRHKALVPFLPPAESYLPVLNFTMEESNELGVVSTDIGDFFKQQYVNWITQGTNVREAWPDFVEQLKRIGVERYVAIHQAAYDRYISE